MIDRSGIVVFLGVAFAMLMCHSSSHAQQFEIPPAHVEPPSGTIEGVITDEECGFPVKYANVVLMGEHIKGGTSDGNGRFSIIGIPVGTYTLTVMMIGYERATFDSVRVSASDTTRLDMTLRYIWNVSDKAEGDRFAATTKCQVHYRKMEMVLVGVGYGLEVVDREYERLRNGEFPNAEPYKRGGCVISPGAPLKAWVPRCRKCIAERNRHLCGSDLEGDASDIPSDWVIRSFGGITFAAPQVLGYEVDTITCGRNLRMETESMTIRAYWGAALAIPDFYHRKYEGRRPGLIVSHVYVPVTVSHDGNGVFVVAIFRRVPVGSKALAIEVATEDEADLDKALTVIRSVRFRME